LIKAFDSGGGMFIHTFGAYYGLSLCFFCHQPTHPIIER